MQYPWRRSPSMRQRSQRRANKKMGDYDIVTLTYWSWSTDFEKNRFNLC